MEQNEQSHGDIIAQIRDLSQSIASLAELQKEAASQMKTHIDADEQFQKTMQPMIKIFEENNIVKVRLGRDFKSLVLYTGGLTTIGAFFYAVYWVAKSLLLR